MTAMAWHQQNRLREEVKAGTLRLAAFAADLNAVRTGETVPIYRDSEAFFSRTYPTYNLKRLVRDGLLRLAGVGGAPVIRFDVSYGGGKTHTLITLLHLAERGRGISGHPTVREFIQFAGLDEVPQARVALLPFDKFDVHEGLVVVGPGGGKRRVRTPWGALAYQLAGDAGFARVKSHEEGFDPPAEPILVDLLRAPQKTGHGTLILLDEAVWYYRALVNHDATKLGTIKDFFHSLVQAVVKVDRCALVATLIASPVEARDATGALVLRALEDEFRRYEENFEPVTKEDLAEILRRRLFEAVVADDERRAVVDAVMATLQQLPLREVQKSQQAYDRLFRSYPFHPDLLDVLYEKWKQFEGFQNARGMLRLLALAARAADGRDGAPLLGPSALLGTGEELTDALVELVDKCKEEADWSKILVGELEKAREVQDEFPSLKAREVEQAVVATFLHSQPRGQRAESPDLYGLLAHPALDVASITEALQKWRDRSWFLTDEPGVWRLGTQPNITHMHVRAVEKISARPGAVDDEVRRRIRAARLADVDPGVVPHNLPDSPRDVADTPALHFVVLPPSCACEPGKPVPGAVAAYFDTTSGPANPRTYRNAVVAVAPDRARLAGLRERVLRWLAWKEVEAGEDARLLSNLQKREVARRRKETEEGLSGAVRATYSVLVAVNEEGGVESASIDPGTGTLFDRVKAALIEDESLLVTTLDPDLFLPSSDFGLWAEGERSKRVKDLLTAFAQFPRLPRLPSPDVLWASLARGVREGKIVLQLPRGDGSVRTLWRVGPSGDEFARPEAVIVPLSAATLHELDPGLLLPGGCEGLWKAEGASVTRADIEAYFDGVRAPRMASSKVLEDAMRSAVRRGLLMLRVQGRVYLREAVPDSPLPAESELLLPPDPVRGADLGPQALPDAWRGERVASLASMARALAKRRGREVPWVLLRDGVEDALRRRLFDVDEGCRWPCDPNEAETVRFRLVELVRLDPSELIAAATQTAWASPSPTLGKIKEAVEAGKGRAIPGDVFRSAVETALRRGLSTLDGSATPLPGGPDIERVRVRLPKASLFAEAQLSPRRIQDFAAMIPRLKQTAPDLDFSFRVTIVAEGERQPQAVLDELNDLLTKVSPDWKLE